MNKFKIANVGVDQERKKYVDEILDKIIKFPERNIIINFKEWLSRLPKDAHRILEDGTIEINSDKFSLVVHGELFLADRVSSLLRVWSPVVFLTHYYLQGKDDEYAHLIKNATEVVVGTVQYRAKSRGLPQYLIHHKDGTVQYAKNYAEAFKLIAGEFLIVPMGSLQHPNGNNSNYSQCVKLPTIKDLEIFQTKEI